MPRTTQPGGAGYPENSPQNSNQPITPVPVESADAIFINFNEYTVHYFSQSSAPWEAAYINCFYRNSPTESKQVGYILFTYEQSVLPPGQENADVSFYPTRIPPTQINHLEPERGYDFFVLYYTLERFDDVVNQLRFCASPDPNDPMTTSMIVSADPINHVWALCNNFRMETGAQYKV
jgi:hypothetical protein